jgi:hypothetical protein
MADFSLRKLYAIRKTREITASPQMNRPAIARLPIARGRHFERDKCLKAVVKKLTNAFVPVKAQLRSISVEKGYSGPCKPASIAGVLV